MLQKEYLKSRPNILDIIWRKYPNAKWLTNVLIYTNPNIDIEEGVKFVREDVGFWSRIRNCVFYNLTDKKVLENRATILYKRDDYNEEFIKKYPDIPFSNKVSNKLSLKYIDDMIDKSTLDWDIISDRKDLTEEFCLRNLEYLDLRKICRLSNISIDFILENMDDENLYLYVLSNPNINFEYIDKIRDIVDFHNFDIYNIISITMMYVNTNTPLTYQYIIMAVSNDLNLVESVIDEEDENCWVYISLNRHLTTKFLEKYIDRPLTWYYISRNKNIDLRFVKAHLDKPWDWKTLSFKEGWDQDLVQHVLNNRFDVLWEYIIPKTWLDVSMLVKLLDYEESLKILLPLVLRHPNIFDDLDLILEKVQLDKVDWYDICQNPAVNLGFIEKNIHNMKYTLEINKFLLDPIAYRRSIMKDIEKRRDTMCIDIQCHIKTYILNYYIGYD